MFSQDGCRLPDQRRQEADPHLLYYDDDLSRQLDWLSNEGCTHVAIESTGIYWKPVINILESSMEVILTNARDAKGFKARKTDVLDAEWLADLLRHGLLKPSFIPPLHIRELRELTRYRESLIRERTSLANRIQKLAERPTSN